MPISLDIKNLRVRSLDVDFNELTWELSSSSLDVLDYTFQLFRSESSMGPFAPISVEFEDQYIFVDNNIKGFDLYRQYHYKLVVKEKSSGDTKEFGPFTMAPEADLIAVELRKHVDLLMREFIGRRCWVLPCRTFGQRCGCWDEDLQKKTRSGCPTCYDTGFVRGYMHPIEMWVSIDPNPKANQYTNVGKMQQQNTTARCGHFPELKPNDVIIEPENLRWRVVSITPTEQVRAKVHQEVQLHLIPKSDIEYRIPLVLDKALKDLFLSPSRNFSNPQTLAAFERDEFPDIVSLYGSTPSNLTNE
jgi:hypothetical protein